MILPGFLLSGILLGPGVGVGGGRMEVSLEACILAEKGRRSPASVWNACSREPISFLSL